MSLIHIRQIKAHLHKTYDDLIDIEDVKNKSLKDQENHFLTRALAAFATQYLLNISPEEAANSITDGFEDNGVDAVYFDKKDKILLIIQSKWSHDGTKTVNRGEFQKFIKGFRDITNARLERFNKKVSAKKKS